jgi:hypothetical protein
VYLARKEYLRRRAEGRGLTVAPAGKIPANYRDAFISLGHIDQDAKHYMGKRLLRDLWSAWRRADGQVSETTILELPAAENSNREAIGLVPAKAAPALPPSTSATRRLPKGQQERAGVTNSNREAVPFLSARANEHAPPPASAICVLPKGQSLCADVTNSLAEKLVPKGRPTTASEVSARLKMPKGQGHIADTKNSVAPQGAGEAIRVVPAKAAPNLPPRQSPRAAR